MDGEDVMFCTTLSVLDTGRGSGCPLCTLLRDYLGHNALKDDHAGIDFIFRVERQADENGPSPKDVPRLRFTTSDPLIWAEYCLYTPAGRRVITLSDRSRLIRIHQTILLPVRS